MTMLGVSKNPCRLTNWSWLSFLATWKNLWKSADAVPTVRQVALNFWPEMTSKSFLGQSQFPRVQEL